MPNSLRDGNNFVTDNTAKADLLNKFFHSVFSSARSDVRDSFSKDSSAMDSHDILSTVEITVSEVISELKNINPTKSSGPDNILGILLKKTLLKQLLHQFVKSNMLLYLGHVPMIWKRANIFPVFRGDEQFLAKNYRPISLLCIVSKILERCVFNHCFPVLSPNI